MWNRILNSEYIRNTLTLVSGNTLAQLIPLLAEPVLTRLFPPEDFGLLALFISISSLFAIVATGRYELAVMLPSKDEDAVNLAGLSFFVTIATSILSLLVVWIFNSPICHILNSPSISSYLYLVPLVVFFTGLTQTLNYWFSRKMNFRKVSIARITQSGTAAGAGIGAGFMRMGPGGLIWAQVLGNVASAAYFLLRFFRIDRHALGQVTGKRMQSMAREYAEFPKVNALYIFTDTAQYSGISFLIAYFFNNILLGFYSRTFRILTVPLSFIGSAISQTFYQKASVIHRNGGNLRRFSLQTLLGSAAVGFPIFLFIILWGPDIFAFVLGQPWRPAGVYAQVLSPWLFMKFITQPLTQLPMILNRQKELFLFSLPGIALIFGSLLYGGLVADDLITGFYLVSITQTLYLALFAAWLIGISGRGKGMSTAN
jgi:O-antigen/teichoic acid export membrane protein